MGGGNVRFCGRNRAPAMCSGWVLKLARAYTVAMRDGRAQEGGKPPSRNTVKKILKAEGIDPGQNRGKGSYRRTLGAEH